MEIDASTSAVIGAISGVISAVAGYGIMREKVTRLEHDLELMQEAKKEFVTFQHFDAVISPIRNTLDVVLRDVKEILKAVNER